MTGQTMTSPKRQAVTIHYRRLEDITGAFGKLSLEAAIRAAMERPIGDEKVHEHWKHRAWVVPPSSEDTFLMNVFHDGGSYYFGDLTHYTKGYLQTLLAEAADTPSLLVEQHPPPKGEVVLLCWTDGGLAKVDSGFDYAANFSSFACVA
jgi:hypothetical protein